MVRTQIYLDPAQTKRLDEIAAESGVSRSEVIRTAVAGYVQRVDSDHEAKRQRALAAIDATFGIVPDLPPGKEYVDAIRAGDGERFRELWGDDRL